MGLDVVAITDHNSVEGGLEARELADRFGLRVIVGEEVKTSEGEVIGLFLQRTIPGGMSFAETIAAIKEQGGIVYVPHPFDRLHTIPSPQVLRANVADIDVIEVFNSRLAFPDSMSSPNASLIAIGYRQPPAAMLTYCPASARRSAESTTSRDLVISSTLSPRAASCAARAVACTCNRSSSSRRRWPAHTRRSRGVAPPEEAWFRLRRVTGEGFAHVARTS